jgi:hypothetical protein
VSVLDGRGLLEERDGQLVLIVRPELAELFLAALDEAPFQRMVIEAMEWHGWDAKLIYHSYDSRRSASGFPDLCATRPPTVLFAELKKQHGVVTKPQAKWGTALAACPGVVYRLWRPLDWQDIVATIR